MEQAQLWGIARALHVIAVVLWIGGVAMVTTVLLPAVRSRQRDDALTAFDRLERRFAAQARWTTLLAGATGFYLAYSMNVWSRFTDIRYWWMHAMTGLWLIFTIVLFIAEPLVLHGYFHKLAHTSPELAFTWLLRGHVILYILALITVFGAALGSHGGF